MSTNLKNMPERLQKRVENHQSKKDSKKENKVTTHEQDDNFSLAFNEAYDNVAKTLSQCPTVSEEDYTEYFEMLSYEFQKLQKYLSDCTPHLSSYKIRSTQQSLTSLQDKIQEEQETFLPKKKFSFKLRPKQNVVKPIDFVDSNEPLESYEVEKTSYDDAINECGFRNMENINLKMTPEEINYKDLTICSLKGCHLTLYGAPCTITITQLVDCTVLCGPVTTSIVFEDCFNCTFVMAGQQVRIHSTTYSRFYLHVVGDPVIEDCQNLQFAPYNWSYSKLHDHIQLAKLDWDDNAWNQVKDFNWLSSEKPSPNWSEISPEDRVACWDI